jgi:hypothetical protein
VTWPGDPQQLRDLAGTAARHPQTTWCFTLTDPDGRPVAHACGTPAPKPPGADDSGPGPPALTQIGRGPPGSRGTWRYTHQGRQILFTFDDLDGDCDHRFQASGHDPGRKLRHLTGVLHPECTFLTCRTPEHQSDYEHSVPTDQGGITCLCACGPVCRRNHRNKQQPGWKIRGTGQPGEFTWTLPSGRTYATRPTTYPI